MNPEKYPNENEQIELEEQAISEPKNDPLMPPPDTHPGTSPLPYTNYDVDVTRQGDQQPYKTTHEMSNEEIDEIAPVPFNEDELIEKINEAMI